MDYSEITGSICTQVRNDNNFYFSEVLLPKAPLSHRKDTLVPSPVSTLIADEFPSPIYDFSPSLLGAQTY